MTTDQARSAHAKLRLDSGEDISQPGERWFSRLTDRELRVVAEDYMRAADLDVRHNTHGRLCLVRALLQVVLSRIVDLDGLYTSSKLETAYSFAASAHRRLAEAYTPA